jgi:hypothetical protein
MRLQLAIALQAALLLCTGSASAQSEAGDAETWSGEVVSRYLLYADDDATTVSTGIIDASVELPYQVGLGAHLLVDAVSSASIDVVSAATERWTEVRAEAGVRANRNFAGTDLGLSYSHSQEQDWASHTLSVGAGRDFFQKNLRIESKLGVVLSRVGRASDPVFEEDLKVYLAEVGLNQLVDTKSRVGVSYGLQDARGFQSSPYRYVAAENGARMPESHPDARLRQWLAGYGLRQLTDSITARIHYRFYLDEWGVRSHAAELRLRVDLSDKIYLASHARGYQQSDADFYRKGYPQAQVYMSSDRELSRFWNLGGGLSLGAQLGPLRLDAKVAMTYYSFKNFAALPTRLATMAGAGATLPW